VYLFICYSFFRVRVFIPEYIGSFLFLLQLFIHSVVLQMCIFSIVIIYFTLFILFQEFGIISRRVLPIMTHTKVSSRNIGQENQLEPLKQIQTY